jgi:hypothetical protein
MFKWLYIPLIGCAFGQPSDEVDPKTIAIQLQALLSDPRFETCEKDPSNPSCMQVRSEAEKTLVRQQNQIDEDILSTRSFLNSLKQELTGKVKELKLMNETLYGSLFAPGLLEQYQGITQSISQLQMVLEGADGAVQKEANLRGELYAQEMATIAEAQQKSAESAQGAILSLANANLQAQSAQIRGIANTFGKSLADISSQANTILAENDQQTADLQAEVDQNSQDVSNQLSVLTQSANVAGQSAKAVAAVGNATFKQAESSLFKAAQAQLPVYQKYADSLLASSQQTMNTSLTNAIQGVSNSIVNLQTNLVQQFADNAQSVYENITKLKEEAAKIVPSSIARAATLMDGANDKISSAQTTAQTSANAVKKLTSDTSSLLGDLMNQIQTVSQSSQDGQNAVRAQLNQAIAGISSGASNTAKSMSEGVANELGSLSAQLGTISASNSKSVQSAQDAYLSQLAGIQASAGSDSLSAMTAISDANAAASSMGKLNTAQLQLSTDRNMLQLNRAASTVQSALSDEGETINDMDAQFASSNRALELNTQQLVSDTNSANTDRVSQLSRTVNSDFQSVQSAALATQKLSQAQVLDLKQAMAALSDGSKATAAQSAKLESMLQGMTADQLNQFQTLLGNIQTSSSLIDTTGSKAQAQLSAAVANTLSARMSALQSTLQSSSSGVNSQLSAAIADASSTAEAMAKSNRNLSGNFQKTNSDMNALISTLSGATTNVSANAQSLQNLLSSMTNQEVVNFQLKVANLTRDASGAQSSLRDYLLAIIANKTDTARANAQGMYYSNQEALAKALNMTSSELAKTQALAAQAVLANQVVRANTTQLFDEFLAMEGRVNNVTSQHAAVLANITKNITDWKTDILTRIHTIQSEVAQGSATLPEYAQQRLDNITALVSSSQGDLKKFLKDFQNALDKAKAVQDHFQDSQAGRIISAMTGVSQAITTASMRMASQVAQSDLSANDKAKALTTVLSELCDSINLANSEAGQNDDAIAAQVRKMTMSLNGSLAGAGNQINAMMTSLATKQLQNDIALSNSMEAAVTNAGVGINASANSLELAQAAIHRAAEKSAAGWANNNKNAYTLGGFLFSLSQESQQKLLYILQQLQSGEMNMNQAINLARQVDISKIKSAQDVVSVLVGAMDGYDQVVESIFGSSYARLQNASDSLSGQVDAVVSDLVTLASVLDFNSSMIAHRVDQFANISNDFISKAQQNVTDLQNYIFDQQSQVTKSLSALGSLMDYSEKDVALRQQQFSNWVDGLIANETQVIANKTNALKNQLIGPKTPASLLETVPTYEAAKENVEMLNLEMKELDRRRSLRRVYQKAISVGVE